MNAVASKITLERLQALSLLPDLTDVRFEGRDKSNPYYDFLYRLAQEIEARRILELGTCSGASASYLSAAHPDCQVITVDIQQHNVVLDRLQRESPNVRPIQGDTTDGRLLPVLRGYAPYDIIFFDTAHVYEVVKREFELYGPFLRAGGVAVFDDIHLNPGMTRFWNELVIPKVELGRLHHSGFGAAIQELQPFIY